MKNLLTAVLALSLFAALPAPHALARDRGGPGYATPAEMNIFNMRVSYAQTHGQLIFRHGVRERGSWVDIYSVPPAPGVPAYCVTVVRSRSRNPPPLNVTVLSSSATGNVYGQIICSGNLLAVQRGSLTRGGNNSSLIITINWQYGLNLTYSGGAQTVPIPQGY